MINAEGPSDGIGDQPLLNPDQVNGDPTDHHEKPPPYVPQFDPPPYPPGGDFSVDLPPIPFYPRVQPYSPGNSDPQEVIVLYDPPPPPPHPAPAPAPKSVYLLHIILSCIVFWCCGWMCGLIAFMLAISAHSSSGVGNRDAARASLVVSIVGIVYGVITTIITVIVIMKNVDY